GRGAAMGTFTASFDLGIGMGSIAMGLILQYAGISQALIGLFGRIAGFTTIYLLGGLIVLAALVLFITGYKNKGET
ncbi:MAG: hypothetical protein KJ729_05325, partial [Euryarchaeota archaeon]|nr:hypothetical protein [Euryarchaeota archaeon]